jgi:hypothetical protein
MSDAFHSSATPAAQLHSIRKLLSLHVQQRSVRCIPKLQLV